MTVVWKYQLDVRQNQLVHMPIDAHIISVGVQNDFPVLWALTEGKGVQTDERIFSVVTTGEEFEATTSLGYYPDHVGTVTLGKDMSGPSAWYVAHVFEGYMKIADNKLDDRKQIIEELGSE